MDNHKPDMRSSHPTSATRTTPQKGYFGLFKLLAIAASLIALAAYIGDRKPAMEGAAEKQDIAIEPTPAVGAGHVILKSGSSQPAAASVGDARIYTSTDGREAYVSGDIGANFAKDLAQVLEANRFLQRIVITSGGGYAGSGLEAARLIRKKNLTVRVKSYCASMCVGLWAAAAAREMEPDAVIGLHQWHPNCESLPDEAQRKECGYQSQFWNAHDVSYDGWLRSAGFNDRLLKLQSDTPANEVAVLATLQLWENGVDFNVVDTEGRYMSREAVRDFLMAKYRRDRPG